MIPHSLLHPVQLRFSTHRFIPMMLLSTLLAALFGCGSSSTGAKVNASSSDFGSVAITTTVRRIAATVTNSGKSDITMSPSLSGSADFAIASDVSCVKTLAPSGICSMVVTFTPSINGAETATLDMGMSSNNQSITLSGTGVQLAAGQSIVSATDHPLVARYTYTPEVSGKVSIQFGPDTNYGLQTAAQDAQAGSPLSILVAGMRGNSTYHMRAVVVESDSTTVTDSDHTFTTSNFSADLLPTLTVTANGTPQPGIEFMNPAAGSNDTYLQAYAVDLQGNVIWGYNYPDRQKGTAIMPFKLLPNGNILVVIGVSSQNVTGPPDPAAPVVVREIDLAGVPVRQVTLPQINAALSDAGYSLTLDDFHHDIVVLPNGHWLVLGDAIKSYSGLPGTSGSSTNVVGDVIVDLDANLKPVWVWNEFDHLDANRAPAGYPDWTHSNAVLYVPSDGNILVSVRHESWIVKVDYRNGAGTGNILWRLGYQGDFTLINGTEPKDWFFAQHQPSFVGSSTSGTFMLTMMDNGYLRQLAPGSVCSGSSCYTTVPVLLVDESAKTATIQWRDTFDPTMFSVWGGGTTPLANGNLEIDLCAEPNASSEVDEVTLTATPQTVWSLKTTGQNLYRANRVPSLYPGVQW